MKTKTVKAKFNIQRLPSSTNGNARFQLIANGEIIGSTRPDCCLADDARNHAERGICEITIRITPTGRHYIDAIKPLYKNK